MNLASFYLVAIFPDAFPLAVVAFKAATRKEDARFANLVLKEHHNCVMIWLRASVLGGRGAGRRYTRK